MSERLNDLESVLGQSGRGGRGGNGMVIVLLIVSSKMCTHHVKMCMYTPNENLNVFIFIFYFLPLVKQQMLLSIPILLSTTTRTERDAGKDVIIKPKLGRTFRKTSKPACLWCTLKEAFRD